MRSSPTLLARQPTQASDPTAHTAPEAEPVISVHNLRKLYGSTVGVEDVSFDVFPGEIFGIAGPNGAGKTTAVECVQGLRRADGGEIRVLGLDPARNIRALRRRIGSQLQQSALPDRIKVWEALDLFASFVPGESDWRLLIEQWGLTGKETTAFADLSGGQQQRLFIALALINDPEIVFLDELTQGLDPAARRVAWDLIRAARDQGTTVVLVTHFMDEAEALCDRLAIIDRGRVIASDTPHRLIAQYGGPTSMSFGAGDHDLSWLSDLRVVDLIERQGDLIRITGSGPVVPLACAALVERGIVPDDLRVDQRTLEDAFLQLTGRGVTKEADDE